MQAAVDDRPDEPAVGVRRQPTLLPEAQQCLLHGVVRQVVAPQDPTGQAPEPRQLWADDLGELVVPAAPSPTIRRRRRASERGPRAMPGRLDQTEPESISRPTRPRRDGSAREFCREFMRNARELSALMTDIVRLLSSVCSMRTTGLGRRDGKGARSEPVASP